MTIRHPYPAPCWEVRDPKTGEHRNEEYWTHHRTAAEAQQELDELLAGYRDVGVDVPTNWRAMQSFPDPCAVITCDHPDVDGFRCGVEYSFGDDPRCRCRCSAHRGAGAGPRDVGSHLDPARPEEHLDDGDWQATRTGEHYCPEHHLTRCVGCDEPTSVFDVEDDELCVPCANLRHPGRVLA